MLSALLLARESKDPGRKTYAIAGTVIGFVYGLLVVGGGAALRGVAWGAIGTRFVTKMLIFYCKNQRKVA